MNKNLTTKRRIIIDVDTGTDDAMALILAILSKEFEILGITVVHGNQPLPFTLENTLRVVQFMGADIPVYAGCPAPMVQTLTPGRMKNQRLQVFEKTVDGKKINIHDEHLPLPAAHISAEEKHAVTFLIETLEQAKEKITVVSVGPPTNLGMALRMKPEITKNIEEIIIMGGGVRRVNRTSAAEMNFYMDPEASEILIQADVRKVILPLDATTSALFTRDDAAKIAALGTPHAVFFASLITEFIERLTILGFSNNDNSADRAIAIHDALCILYLLDPSLVTDLRRETCDVDFSGGYADGALIVDSRSAYEKRGQNYVAYHVDKERVMEMLSERLAIPAATV